MQQVFRQEHKHLTGMLEYKKYCHYFNHILKQDAHNGTDGYIIRSLYFDTLEEDDFFDKQEGLEVRKKIRLRLYDPDGDFAMLEMKQKQGAQQMKRSLRLDRSDAICLTKGIYSPLLKYREPFAAECFAVMNTECYRPKTVVKYKRKAFVAQENQIRITFDHSIAATESCFDLFSGRLPVYPVMDSNHVVLEVKYNGFLLSYIKDMINECDKSSLSASKYCLGRSVSLKYMF